jgi:PAS domain S-box-containing protein
LIIDERGTILEFNPAAVNTFGYSSDSAVGQQMYELILPLRLREQHRAALANYVATREATEIGKRIEISALRADGSEFPAELTITPVADSTRPIFTVFIRDITERKQTEAALQQTNHSLERALAELQTKTNELTSMTQQLWQASKLATMGELTASIAHELNNPLAIISLRVELLMSRVAANDPQFGSLEVIQQEVERMASLVANLLLFSRRSHQQVSTINIAEELKHSLEFINYHLRSRKIVVATDFANDLSTVQGDTQQLRQVFLNLLTNATDAMPEGGTLTVRAKDRNLETGAPGVILEFSDSGTGIEPANLAKVWDPFFTTKPEGKGTGLGLPICRRTVEEHRGTIDLESQPRKGTTVRIVLPATEGQMGKP